MIEPISMQYVAAHATKAVLDLYNEVDIPAPTPGMPIAPLGPLLNRLNVTHEAIEALTAHKAEAFLRNRSVLGIDGLGLTGNLTERLAGFLYASGRVARLFVNSDDPVVRRRFSIAHELGHFVMHFRPRLSRWREALESDQAVPAALYDAFTLPEGEEEAEGDSQEFDRQEREADAFAAALLMPLDIVQERANALKSVFLGDSLIDRLAMEMLVSQAAMRRRLHALTPIGRKV